MMEYIQPVGDYNITMTMIMQLKIHAEYEGKADAEHTHDMAVTGEIHVMRSYS